MVHRAYFDLCFRLPADRRQRWSPRGACVRRANSLIISLSHQHTVVLSTPTCVAVLASCQETKVACKIAQRSAEVVASLITCSTLSRLRVTLRMSTCARHSFTCVAWYVLISVLSRFFAQIYTSLAVRSPSDEATRWEDVFLPTRMQYAQARRFYIVPAFY